MASSLDFGVFRQSHLKCPILPHQKHFATAHAASISIGAPHPPYVVPVAVFVIGMLVDV